jgi:hypothetical protein
MDLTKKIEALLLQICTYVIPISLILYYYFPKIRPALFIHMIIVASIGNIETHNSIIFSTWLEKIISYFFHMLLILILFLFKPTSYINIYSVLLNILVLLPVLFHPKWIYTMSKERVLITYYIKYIVIAFTVLVLFPFFKKFE